MRSTLPRPRSTTRPRASGRCASRRWAPAATFTPWSGSTCGTRSRACASPGRSKRELTQLNPFELVLLMVLGDLVQQGVTQEDHSLIGAIVVVSTLALLTVLTSWIAFRSTRFAHV